MTTLELLEGLNIRRTDGPLNIEIKGLAYDSRLVEKDFIFVAVKGFRVDGHDYIKDALSRGAAAIIMENAIVADAKQHADLNSTSFVEVPESRKTLALISSAFYGHPSKSLSLIGITGTNGKTTTSFITKSIIEAGGSKAGLIGTISCMTGERTEVSVNTTPESLDLQRYLSEMVTNKMEYAVLEVSSHALSLDRVKGCTYKAAAFTNFTQDHLDFHNTMTEYFRVKTRIFDSLAEDGKVVLNMDDPMIRPIAQEIKRDVVTFGIKSNAMIRAENISDNSVVLSGGLSFDVRTPDGGFRVDSKLMGRFNVYNILASIGIAYALGIDEDTIKKGVRAAEPVEGRFENLDEGQDFLCIVDYAHTEDALRKLIDEARFMTKGRVITVVGCGGDRDSSKRPLMGFAASELSDLVFITSDNPRTEDPMEIIKNMLKG
ncbi:MAG TPA: UDP-N-acetylmuramoyl-L-alanyl-D-glutamate--2,6-diaminopimelate ligase, partial [Nitrospirae bacterium]|nr:UDP-N-acetylmuramoyl-L-alanyl-D-glutamate--2,6-diaminopimelate ligase [Nitrospirota bacterium]HDZ84113.1 UDP-N-acetylmuramoyl-L-alanyl-D-glutamate--2,6-diaminopimelate ligase [Nitrospirota bacterium]